MSMLRDVKQSSVMALEKIAAFVEQKASSTENFLKNSQCQASQLNAKLPALTSVANAWQGCVRMKRLEQAHQNLACHNVQVATEMQCLQQAQQSLQICRSSAASEVQLLSLPETSAHSEFTETKNIFEQVIASQASRMEQQILIQNKGD